MSRFGNLEFGEEPRQPGRAVEVKGEAYYLAEARQFYEEGHFEAALRSFAKVLEYNPRNPAAWGGQVRMLIELGEFSEAGLWADKALEMFPREPEILAAKAVALARLGDLKGALAFSDAAMSEQGDTPYVWVARGDVLCARRETRAGYCFEKATMMNPTDWLLPWLISRVHHFYEQFSLALKYAQQALRLNSAQAAVWLQVGQCQHALGLFGLAHHSFDQALQLDPRNAAARAALNDLAALGPLARLWRRLRHLFQ